MVGFSTAARRSLNRQSRAFACAAAVCLSCFFGQSPGAQTPEDGLQSGPWVVAPYFAANYQFNDNVLLRNEQSAQSDRVRDSVLGVVSTLYFRNSNLQLSYEGNRKVYETRGLNDALSHDFDAEVNLRFGNGTQLQIAERYSRGNSDVERIDDSGERTFDGERFDVNTWELDFSREVPKMRGFRVNLSGNRLRNRGDDVPFFDYDRLEGLGEYREPVGPRMWLTATFESRRSDHLDPATGNRFREERRDAARVGFRGLNRGGQPFFLSVGAERFSFEGRDPTEYSGLSMLAQWIVPLGRYSQIRLLASRRALPSFFGTYYLVHDVDVGFDRTLFRRSRTGISARFSRNRYGDPVDLDGDGIAEDFRRQDSFKSAETFLEFKPSPRIGFRVGLRYRRRDSNYANADYENMVFTTSVLLGWPR